MLNNNFYNLIRQLTQESCSLWRIKNKYMKDAKDSPESKKFWEKLKCDKEEHIVDLKELIKEELK